jgi:large subunit ribosomal protein L2
MGKRIISQRRGRGTSTYRVPKSSIKADVKYMDRSGSVIDIVNDPARDAPLAKIRYDDGSIGYLIAPKGMKVGDSTGFIDHLGNVAVGSQVFAIEKSPNSGPAFCRTSGSFATVSSKAKNKVILKLPSKKVIELNPRCRVSLGIPAGDGKHEKPWLKAGKKWHAMHRKGKLYPRTSGVAMNAVDHPFGGPTKPGKSMSVSRHAPPGRKVGSWGGRRSGKKK